MPLRIANVATKSSIKDLNDQFLIFYSSVVDGVLWCPDCQAVEEIIQNTFVSRHSPEASIVYVGDKPESNTYVALFRWKSPSNTFRGKPWNIQSIPTIVRIRNGIEDGRLVEGAIEGGLETFVQE